MPRYIGEYEIRKELGHGGFGRVYLCFDARVQRPVAIKVLNEIGDRALIERFKQEAIATSNLNHPNIVTVYGSGEHDGVPYIVMQYLEGQTLFAIIESKRPVILLDKVEWMWHVAEGLLYAHKKQVVHRDVKPANIQILPDGSVKVLDFGIAKVLRPGMTRHTEGSAIIGTLSYMSPEQLSGGEVDTLWDIWSYGTIYYELLTLVQPFRADSAVAVIDRVMHVDPPPLRSLVSECPVELERIVHRLLSRNRETRFQSLEDVQFEIAPILKDLRAREASSLLDRARVYWRDGKLDDLPNMVRRILDLDPANAEARKIRGDLQKETDKRRIGPKVTALLQQAEKQAAKRDFAGAMQSLDTAQSLSPDDSSIRNFRVRLKTTWVNIQEAESLVSQARTHLDSNDPGAALRCITSAMRLDRENAGAQKMLIDIRAALDEQEKARRLQNELSRVDVFLGIDAFQEAADLLNRLSRENPNSAEVAELSTRLLEKREQKAIRNGLAGANEDLRAGRLQEAIARLEFLASVYPQSAEVRDQLSEVRDKLAARIRDEYCHQVSEETEGLLKINAFDQAIQAVTQALRRYPDQASLVNLRQTVEARKAEYEKALRLQAGLLRCAELRGRGQLREAQETVALLARELGESGPLAAERDALNTAILAAVDEALARAGALSREEKFDDALSILRRAMSEFDNELRLREALETVLDRQRQAERAREVQASLGEVFAAEARVDLDGALLLLAKALERLGPVPELEAAAIRIRTRQSIARYLVEIRRAIEARDWNAAQFAIARATEDHPAEPLWTQPAEEIRAGRTLSILEAYLAGSDFDAASLELKEARKINPPVPGLEDIAARLAAAQQRIRRLRKARKAAKQGDFVEAEQLLSGLRALYPDDLEVLEALREVDDLKGIAERRARFESTYASARAFLEQGSLVEGIDLLEGLLELDPGNLRVQGDLRTARAEQEGLRLRQATTEALQSAEILARELSAPPAAIFALLDRVDSLAQKRPELNAFQERADRLRRAWEEYDSVQGQIQAQDWVAALKHINERKQADPIHDWLWENAARKWQEALASAVAKALTEGDAARAHELLMQARMFEPQMASIPSFESQLARLEARNDWLYQARELLAQDRISELDTLIRNLPDENRSDPEISHVLQSIQAARAEADRQSRRREGLAHGTALREAAQFESALDILSDLAEEHPGDAEIAAALRQTLADRQAAQRLSLIEESKEKASALMRQDNPGAVASLLQYALIQVGGDPILSELLAEAEGRLRELERTEGIAACLANATGLEQAGRLSEALETLSQGLERWGSDADLETARMRIAVRKDAEDRESDVGQKIGRSAWTEAEVALTQAAQTHPDSEVWTRLRLQLRNGRILQDLKQAVSIGDVAGLAGLVEQARASDPPFPDLAFWEERLTIEQTRREALTRAASLGQSEQYSEAEQVVLKVLESHPTDTEARTLLDEIRRLAAAKDRTVRFNQSHAEIQQFRAAGQFDAAVGALERLIRDFPERVELREEMREVKQEKQQRLAVLKDAEDRESDIRRKIGRSAWTEAEVALTQAAEAHPDSEVWTRLRLQLRNGRMLQDLKQAVSIGDVAGLAGLVEQARASDPPFPDLAFWEERLTIEQTRREALTRAASLRQSEQYSEAEQIVLKVLESHPTDTEARTLLDGIRRLAAAKDRTVRFNQSHVEIQQFRAAGQFDAAVGALERLIKDFPERLELREEMREVQQAKQQRLREEELASGKAEAMVLAQKGDHNAALRRYDTLLKRFPGDAALGQGRAAALASKEADEARRKARRERERAERMIAENRFNEALKILDPLIREFPKDSDLQGAWRLAMTGRGSRANWLEVYEQLTEIESLYHKGKARKVRDGASKILESIEEPRARWFLEWAEQKLKEEPEAPSARESLAKWMKDKFK